MALISGGVSAITYGMEKQMDLSKYEKILDERMEQVPFPIPVEELCSRYEKLFTGAVNDVLREEGLIAQTLPNNIVPLREEMKLCGTAFTVAGCQSLELKNEMEERAKMLEAIGPGNVVVWDTSGDQISAQWGEMMTKVARSRGCRGAVVDGGVRDTAKVLEQKFPVFCKYRSSNGMLGRFRITAWQAPIRIGEVNIYPGDVVFGDIDGVLIIPRRLAYDVLLRAEAIRDNEEKIARMIDNHMSPTEVVENGGYF